MAKFTSCNSIFRMGFFFALLICLSALACSDRDFDLGELGDESNAASEGSGKQDVSEGLDEIDQRGTDGSVAGEWQDEEQYKDQDDSVAEGNTNEVDDDVEENDDAVTDEEDAEGESQEELEGEACGVVTCEEGMVCCNESCGICVPPDDSCTQQLCGDNPDPDPEPDPASCDSANCGPAPLMPNRICPDGTVAGPVCKMLDDGTCGWQIIECPPVDEKTCGAGTSDSCGKDEYCDAQNCGKGLETGTCQPQPTICDKMLDPVCGCDGEEYSNPCMAHSAGTEVAHSGSCLSKGQDCGGIAGFACPIDQYCEYPPGTCNWADGMGTCKDRPQICTMEYNPVCGCNGTTYGNSCAAVRANVSVDYQGEC